MFDERSTPDFFVLARVGVRWSADAQRQAERIPKDLGTDLQSDPRHARDGKVRSRGGLRTNYFAHVRKLFVDKRPVLEIEELGSAEALLSNRAYLRKTARESIKRGIIPEEDGWGGWLGRYQAALHRATLEEAARETCARGQARLRERDR